MTRYDATFEITSKSDAYAVQRLVERAYDMVREEVQRCDREAAVSNDALREFETLCEVASRPPPGKLTVVYERLDAADSDGES